ncbi:GCN3 [Sanghuangporus weigelae]
MSIPSSPVDSLRRASQFDINGSYRRILADEKISTPLAAILALTELIEQSNAGTMFELVQALHEGAEALRKQYTNSISIDAGCELFIAFVTLFPHESASFNDLKIELVKQGREYANEALSYREKIAQQALGFIKDGSVILTHSYSRVVMQALLLAHKQKRISVYVTEARPRGLGLDRIKTQEALAAAGIPCTVVLDSAVAYVMDKVDLVLVGSEAVVESGGLINAVGSNQMAIIAKAANKPVYAMAESYKFHRLFPLSQYDLPTHTSDILSFPLQPARPSVSKSLPSSPIKPTAQTYLSSHATFFSEFQMTLEQIRLNPEVDYTRPDLISLVFSDVGILTPEGVSQYLVGMFAG